MKILVSILLLLLTSCNFKNIKPGSVTNSFKPPIIIEQIKTDSLEIWKTDAINEVYPKFIGQYKFSDTVFLNQERQQRHINEEQEKWESKAFDFDTLSSDGLQIYTDYEKSIYSKLVYDAPKFNQYFPVYVVNETSAPKLFIAKDGYVFAIQEAVDTTSFKSWYAIESRGFDFCGNGYFRRKILPH